MGWGESREQRRWQRELEAEIRALPTYHDETPDGGPVEPLARDLPRPPRRRRARARRRSPVPMAGATVAARRHERRRTVLTVSVTLAVITAVFLAGNTPLVAALRGLFNLDGDRGPTSSYAFLQTRSNGDPVTWSSCEPIRYQVNPDGAPSGWADTLEEAMRAITRASGLEFDDVGLTDRRDLDEGPGVTFGGGDPQPVLVAWATPEEVPALAGDTVGVAGPETWSSPMGRAMYESGHVVLDGPAFAQMETEGDERLQRAVVVHELGHLVGLDHVDDERQLMYPSTTYRTTLGNGDLEGLRQLGEGPCA